MSSDISGSPALRDRQFPIRILRYEAGRVARVAWDGGVDSEVAGSVPVPEDVGIDPGLVRVRSGAVVDSWASTLSGP